MASSPLIFEFYAPQAFSRMPERLRSRLWTWLPVAACAIVLAVESTSYFGSDHTSAPLQRAAEAIFGYDVAVHWRLIHALIRKTGHFMGYGVFSLACFRGFWIALERPAFHLPRQMRAHGLAILATFLAGGVDEFHQSFLANRSGQFSDVLLDTCGAVAFCLALFLIMRAAGWWRSRPLDLSRTKIRKGSGSQTLVAARVY